MNVLRNPSYIYKGILIVQIMLMIDAAFRLFNLETSQSLSLIRYIFYFLGVYWLFRGIKNDRQSIPIVYRLFLFWVAYLIITALPELFNPFQNYVCFKSFISGKLFIYFLPFLICADLDANLFKSIFKLSYYMVLAYLILAIPFYVSDSTFLTRGMSEHLTFLVEGTILILMTLPYQNRKTIVVVTIAVIVAIVIMMLLARRNKVVYYGGGLGLAIILNVLKGKLGIGYKLLIVIMTFMGLTFIFNSGNLFGTFFKRVGTGMSSRELVIDDFYKDFNRTPNDWIYGRGLFGEFDAGFLNNKKTGLRDAIENGYLQHILKGGWIWLGLFILVSIKSIYQGLFHSDNILVKGCALFLLLYFVDMIGFGVPVSSLKYIMIFLSISVCSSMKWRSYTDEELQDILNL